MLKRLALALLFTTALVDAAHAEPITISLFGAAFAATAGGWVVTTLFGVAASWIGGQVINWLFPPTPVAEAETAANNAITEVKYGERVTYNGVFGECPIAGHRVHVVEWDNAKKLGQIFILADAWITSLACIYIDGRRFDLVEQSLSANNEHKRYYVDTYDALIEVRLHDGRPGQLPDAEIVSVSTDWDGAEYFSGHAYVVVRLISDRDKFNSIPEFTFVPRGQRLYDPRKDSSIGGTGTHRFNNPATWEYSLNPAVQAYHYLRGFYFNGRRMLGVGFIPSAINLAAFINAMNVCDETVTRPDATTRKRYECHYAFDDMMQYAAVLTTLCEAMGGYHAELAGQLVIYAGKAQASVMTIHDGDLVLDEEVIFNQKRAGEALFTGINGTYTHSTDYTATPYTSIEPPSLIPANWYPRIQTRDFPQVHDAHQAYLLANQQLKANQVQGTASICLDIKNVIGQTNDWITWISDSPSRGTRLWMITATSFDLQKQRLYLQLQETSVEVYDDDATVDDIIEPVIVRPISGYQTTVTSFDATPTILESPSGARLPALTFTYDAIIDPAVSAVKIEFKTKQVGEIGDPDYVPEGPVTNVTDASPEDGNFFTSAGVAPGHIYLSRASLISLPGRETFPTGWIETDFPTEDVTAITEVGDNTITLEKLVQDIRNQLGLLTGYGPGSVRSTIQAVKDEIERLASSNLTDQTTNRKDLRILEAQNSRGAAAVIEERVARVSDNEAFASALLQVTAEFQQQLTDLEDGLGDVISNSLASGFIQLTALTTPGVAKASVIAKVRAEVDGAFSEAAWIITAEVVGSSVVSTFGVFADRFFVTDGVNTNNPLAFVGGVLTLDEMHFRMLRSLDGTTIVMDGTTGNFSFGAP